MPIDSPEPRFEGSEPLESRLDARDRAGRARAVDPRFNVALEASAGTGKTRVLVERYVNLLKASVDPAHVLAVTFTRKAAAEMRARVVATLSEAAERGEIAPARWRELRDRIGDISVSTIDAFCLSLLREFPLEADLDPGFSLADETDVPRLIDESLDRALRICRDIARTDEHVALVFAQLGDRRARRGLAALLGRRLVAPDVLGRYLARGAGALTVGAVVEGAARALLDTFDRMRGGLDGFAATGPLHPGFQVLVRDLQELRATMAGGRVPDPSAVQRSFVRTTDYVLTREGRPRQRQLAYGRTAFAGESNWRVHRSIVFEHGAAIVAVSQAFKRNLNGLVARGTWRMYRVAEAEYRRTLDAHALLDFTDVLLKAVALLRQMEEFAQSRFRLESRYHHVLIDEFQDTSRAQWELIALLVQAWGAGVGAAHEGPLPPSIFIVGDRKQSIYGFRDADVSLLREASRHLEALRPDGDVRRSISRSYRSVPALLAFVNDVCHDVEKVGERQDAFRYDEQDRFPVEWSAPPEAEPLIGLIGGETAEACAAAAAAEIQRLLSAGAVVRDRETGVPRAMTAGDVAILFRTRESHREFEVALARRGIAAHVYKGLGFFDADEVKDVRSLLWYLADPASDLRAASVLRSRVVRLSDDALRILAPRLARALGDGPTPAQRLRLTADDDDALRLAHASFVRWRSLVDRLPPAELLDRVLHESGYAVELRGVRFDQARENLKKIRALIRRLQNRGYATLAGVASHLDHLAIGDEANAPVDARNAVSLMTVHASKGLEFSVVFVVNLARGTAGSRDPIRVFGDPAVDLVSVSVGDFLSESDDDASAREREETKRLLYVALTRARDRLYLSAALKEGRVQPGRGSLAEVLPASLLALFASHGSNSTPAWTSSAGREHRVLHVRLAEAPPPLTEPAPSASVDLARPVDREPLVVSAGRQTGLRAAGATSPEWPDDAHRSDRLVGLTVHRLLQRCGFESSALPHDVPGLVLGLLRREELSELDDPVPFVAAVEGTYRRMCELDEVRQLYEKGTCFHEVPFSLHEPDGVARGVIDCLVRVSERQFVVLEFKTGRPRPEHDLQVALYCRAANRLFPSSVVESRLVYA